jgi:hypothetical protein
MKNLTLRYSQNTLSVNNFLHVQQGYNFSHFPWPKRRKADTIVPSSPSAPIRVFSVECCTAETLPVERSVPDPAAEFRTLYREQERRKRILGWRRTHTDPFAGEWEQITSWLLANPERSSGDIFRELQRLSPRRYHPLQIRTDASRDAQNTIPPAWNL